MNLKELNSFKLSDAVTFHDKLNPKLWNGTKLRPEVREQLLVIAQDFLQELGVNDLDVKDITISGSNAAYSYTKHSDLDLHILVDMGNLPADEVYRELFNAKKTIYNDTHDIKLNNIPVELYVQDSRQPVGSLGEYSVMNDEWIKIPTKRRSDFDQTATKSKYEKLLSLIEIALKSKKYSKVKHIIDTIKRYRQAGLDKGGEFGPENLAFKMLRSQGYITKLYELRDKLHSEKLSFETMYQNISEDQEIHNYKKLDNILQQLCELVVKGQHSDKDYGMVAACVLDPDNNIVSGLNRPGVDGKRIHAERVAIEKYEHQYGEIPEGSIVITTLSPCNEHNDETAEERMGDSCTDYLNSKGIEKVYCGYMDPTQDNLNRNFNLMETSNKSIRHECKKFADTFLKKDIDEEINPDILDPRFSHKQEIGDYTYTAGLEPDRFHKADLFVVRCYDGDKMIGQAKFYTTFGDSLVSALTTVHPEYQKQGIASTMYAYARMLGNTIEPSASQLPPGKKMWKAWKKSGDDQYLMKNVEEDYTGQFAAEKTPPVSPYAGVKDNQYRGGISEASGYIPSEKEKNDPRFKTALTVDINPYTMKKGAKQFGWNISRAGIPPTAKTNGKI